MCTVLGGTGGDSLFYFNSNLSEMPRTGSIRVKANNSNHNFALGSATTAFFSWRAIAKVYSLMSLGLEEVTLEEAKGYTKVLLIFVSAVVLSGMLEGGAL